MAKQAEQAGRLFVVRCMATDEAAWPDALKDPDGAALPGYWLHALVRPGELSEPWSWPTRSDSDSEYWKEVKRLARKITNQLQKLA